MFDTAHQLIKGRSTYQGRVLVSLCSNHFFFALRSHFTTRTLFRRGRNSKENRNGANYDWVYAYHIKAAVPLGVESGAGWDESKDLGPEDGFFE